MKLSARNQFKGTIVSIDKGAVNGIVKIDIGGGNIISSTISMAAIKELELEVGKQAYAVIKATSVMVGVDDLDWGKGEAFASLFLLGDEMATLEQAIELIESSVIPLEASEKRPVENTLHRVLAQDVKALISQPPFRRSAMDGYAVHHDDVVSASRDCPVCLPVVGRAYAGDLPFGELKKGQAVRIMTGGVVPDGCDYVIQQEFTDYGEDVVHIFRGEGRNDNICPMGGDFASGTVLAKKGTYVDPYLIATAVAGGVTELCVRPRLRVSIVTTGSELVRSGETLLPGQIYDSQMPYLKARLSELDCSVSFEASIQDDISKLGETVRNAASESDLVITTGGVSVGKADHMPAVLEKLGATIVFHGIAIKPGMPTTFSMLDGKPVLSLSGNPYSAIAMLELLFPTIEACLLGRTSSRLVKIHSTLANGFSKGSPSRRILRGTIGFDGVHIPEGQRNGQLSSGIQSDCLVDIPAGSEALGTGTPCDCYLLR